MQTKVKRILYAATAIVLAATLAVGGTFAYRTRERRSNIMQGRANYQARLVENFDPDQEWQRDQEITKQVSVKNMGHNDPARPGERWGDIFVRVQILEYMDITKIDYLYFAGSGQPHIPLTHPGNNPEPLSLMINKNGDFVRLTNAQFATLTGTTPAALQGQLAAAYDWTTVISDAAARDAFLLDLARDMLRTPGGRQWVPVTGALFQPDGYFLPTQAGDPNGQYGSYLAMEVVRGDVTIIAGRQRVPYGQGNHLQYLEHYDVHLWNNGNPETCGLATHEFAEFVLGEHAWIMLDDWIAGGHRVGPVTTPVLTPRQEGPFWILDPATGWAYWGQPLPPAPANNETLKLLEAILPIVDLEDEMFYDVYVHMEALNLNELRESDWVIRPAERFRFSNPTNVPFSTSALPAPYTHPNTSQAMAAGSVVWSSSSPSIATVSSTGAVNVLGPAGTATITATITPTGGGTPYTASYTITVTDDTPAPTVTGVTVSPASASMQKGGPTQTFTATVQGTNSPPQGVTWSITPAANGVSITPGGVVTVTAGSTASTATVRATSTHTGTVFGEATITLTAAAPTVTGVTVSPASASMQKGGPTQTFTATVQGTNSPPQGVTWSITPAANGVSITPGGVVTVTAGSTASTATVRATSTHTGTVFGEATITLVDISTELPLREDPLPPFPTDVEEADGLALGAVVQFQVVDGVIHFQHAPANPQRGHGYLPLNYFLDDAIIADPTPITIDSFSADVIDAANVRIGTGVRMTRMVRVVDYTDRACIVIDFLPTEAQLKAMPFVDGLYQTEIQFRLKQGDRTSELITVTVQYSGQFVQVGG